MPEYSLSALATDLHLVAGHLATDVDQRTWDSAERRAKELLSLASRMYARVSAIRDAQRELDR